VAVLGLTGGVASGKSTVLGILSGKGALTLDADQIARQVVMPGSDTYSRVVDIFGGQVVAHDGRIDRAALATIVFSDPALRHELEAVTHPARVAEITQRLAEAPPGAIAVVEAALLIEKSERLSGKLDFDALILVAAAPAQQLERMRPRAMPPGQAEARIAAQATLEHKRAAADYLIDNSGTLEELGRRVEALWPQLVARFGRGQ
jgi:dephospho-CoA kinase